MMAIKFLKFPISAAVAVTLCSIAASSLAATVADIVAGAKKEGTVSIAINSELGQPGIQRLRKEIASEFGVDLNIRYSPVGSYPKRLADIITESKAGIPASYDLTQFSDNVLAQARAAGVLAPVAWREILLPGTPREAVYEAYDALHLYDSQIGMMYSADVVKDGEVPKSIMQLGERKWRDKLTAYFYSSSYLTYAYVLGKDKVLTALQGARDNNAVFDSYSANLSRFTSGEYPIQLTSSGYMSNARKKGINAKWQSLDFSFNTHHAAVVPKGARNPNAAKLVAIYLAGPKGNKISQDLSYVGNAAYAGHVGHEIAQGDKKSGLKLVSPISDPNAMKFLLSDEGKTLEKSIGSIIFRK
ncbi:MAG: extracellular solute-binding protein [Burkholderiales bacterium]